MVNYAFGTQFLKTITQNNTQGSIFGIISCQSVWFFGGGQGGGVVMVSFFKNDGATQGL